MKNVFMERAIELASKGVGLTSPNPSVGAVIVKGGEIVAEGWHEGAGKAHAEIEAMDKIMKKSGIITVDLEPKLFQNATLYVTLEPCAHHGKTPPCAYALVKAGFKRVCIGMKDPFKSVNGEGIKILKKAGIKVEVCRANSKLGKKVKALNQPFIKWAKFNMPYVILKAGVSLDGRIATSSGNSKWITSDSARKDSRLERSKADAVIVGSGTVLADNPELAASAEFKGKKDLLRVIIDRNLSLDLNFKVFRDKNVFVATSDLAEKSRKKLYESKGVAFKSFGKDGVDLESLLKFLAKNEVQKVFVEGGSNTHGLFYDLELKKGNIVDEILVYMAPKILGGKDSLQMIGGEGVKKVTDAKLFKDFEVEVVDKDLKMRGVYSFY